MAREIENSLVSFARPVSWAPLAILSAVVLTGLIIGLITAVTVQYWINAVMFIVSIVAFGGFAFLNWRRTRELAAASDQKLIDCQSALPEVQRQSLNIEVFELSKILEVESAQISDLQSAYIVAEDLALRQIQQEENVPLMRHITLAKAPFDAVLVKNDVISCIEVAFLVAPDLRQDKVDAMMRKIALVKRTFGEMEIRMKVRLMMVLVTQLTPEDEGHLRSVLNSNRFAETPVDIDIRLLDFESLQRIYVTD
ncbi:MAG: hypothetical protein ABIU09_04690 [Pyrinomonadaceae bacterium]